MRTKRIRTFEDEVESALKSNAKAAIEVMLDALRQKGAIRTAVSSTSVNAMYLDESGFSDHLDLQLGRQLGEIIISEAVKIKSDDRHSPGYTLVEMSIEVVRKR